VDWRAKTGVGEIFGRHQGARQLTNADSVSCNLQRLKLQTMGKRRKLSNGSFQAVSAPQLESKEDDKMGAPDQRRSLFVRSLPASVTTERLAEFFSQSFPVKHSTVIVDPATKISKGYGFVTFTDQEDAQTAVSQLNNSTLDGRKIKVEVAESRHRDADDGAKKSVNTTAERLRSQRESQRQDTQPPRLIVRNLPWSIKDHDDLAKLFMSYGKVKHAVVPKKNPKMQYGFGIVILRGRKNAERALAGLNGKEVDGRILAVDWAVDKQTWEQIQRNELAAQKDVATENADPSKADPTALNTLTDSSTDPQQDRSSPLEDDALEDADEDAVSAASEASDDEDASDAEESVQRPTENVTTVFVRNLPYEADDDVLKSRFKVFGPVRYARVVYDPETERSKGTAFVCFFNEADAKNCVKSAPKKNTTISDKRQHGPDASRSVLQNDAADPSGKYTMDGRVLQVTRALNKADAHHRAEEASEKRLKRDGDKRRLYLLSEGTISPSSSLYNRLGKAEIDIRESSARQRQKLIKNNPNLGLSLTRLSVRNLPRHVGGKDLKALAREAVVGFAKDVKDGTRQPLTKDELKRGGDEMKDAEKKRKAKGVGIVKQAKIVFEGREGGKVQEGAGRSRGYGFIEYYTHRSALAGLRWLNGHQVKPPGGSGESAKRLIVEFAIENAQVVQRRSERETQQVERCRTKRQTNDGASAETLQDKKRKRPADEEAAVEKPAPSQEEKNRAAKRNRIIAKKRKARKG
jgi:nucleolar protein 4